MQINCNNMNSLNILDSSNRFFFPVTTLIVRKTKFSNEIYRPFMKSPICYMVEARSQQGKNFFNPWPLGCPLYNLLHLCVFLPLLGSLSSRFLTICTDDDDDATVAPVERVDGRACSGGDRDGTTRSGELCEC